MSLTTCTVHFTNRADKNLYMTRALMRELQIRSQKTLTLKVGHRQSKVGLRVIKKAGRHIYLPGSVRNALLIPRAGNCCIKSEGDGIIKLGPLIGILTSTAGGTGSTPFGSRTGMVRQYLQAGNTKAYYFAFAPQDINWQQETTVGYFAEPGGKWVRKLVSLPDAVYNRLPSRRQELTISMENFKERFVRRNIPIFNWRFFNKSEVYRLLQGEPEEKYVPESVVNPPPEKIKEMLERNQFVYLKPTGGSLGIGIYRLTYHPKKGYFCRYRRNGKNVLLRFNRFSALLDLLRKSRNLNHYVLQQGIRLIEIDNCPIDFRFHMCKNGKNRWTVAGVGAKKAGRGSVTTHVRTGGQLMTPEAALAKTFGNRAEEILNNAKKAVISLCQAIERNYPHPLGEIGFDMGIDKNENIWMFEANSKPGRTIFKHPALKAQGRDALHCVFEYLLYLSKFPVREDA
ncbi:MAG TPA: YheC/YheD family protein [Bacilli bacterium]